MIRSYKYLDCAVQLKLHEFVIAFFNRIEFERGEFKEAFFGAPLGWLAQRHEEIIKERCIAIYNEIRPWNLKRRTQLFNAIRESNEIEAICRGEHVPKRIDNTATGFEAMIRTFFLGLYNQVINGNPFNEQYNTNLTEHFKAFSELNGDITICPVCGICELKKHTDDIRDQYDHYLPKALYPFSAVNFKNLVPICSDCNSLQIKGDTDVVAVATNKKLFFPYDTAHKGISVSFQIIKDNRNLIEIEWQILFHNLDNKVDEIATWKTIYKIERRYLGFVNGRIEKWYSHYWEFMNRSAVAQLCDATKQSCYDAFLEIDEEQKLNFIRKPALLGFISGSPFAQATIEARRYSLPSA